jgi:DNA modification methylase
MEINKIYNESCIETMSKMVDNFIDLTVTSPPYDNLRLYKGYVFDFKNIAKELYRITKIGGVLVWIINDETVKGSESGTSFRHALHFMNLGFNLHDTMIYLKPNPSYPASAKSNRYSQVFEYMFIFSKGKPKTVNLIKDRKNKWGGKSSFGVHTQRKRNGELERRSIIKVQEIGYRFNVWNYSTGKGFSSKDKIAFQHPAIFPEKLAEDHIISWSNEDDIIYDPFAGSGTTLKMALINNRQFIGSEISTEYTNIIEERLQKFIVKDIL